MKSPVRLKTSSYNRDDILKIIKDNNLHCECCNQMWFDLDFYAIEHAIGSGPLLKLECKECGVTNDFHIFNLKRPIPHESEEGDEKMCYSGKCRYEQYMGDCNIPSKLGTDKMPQDADCVQAEYHILEQYLLDDYYNKINGVKDENLIEEVERFYRKIKGEGCSHE